MHFQSIGYTKKTHQNNNKNKQTWKLKFLVLAIVFVFPPFLKKRNFIAQQCLQSVPKMTIFDIQKWIWRLQKYISIKGEYFEGLELKEQEFGS